MATKFDHAEIAATSLGLTRRQFMQRLGGLCALGLLDPMIVAQAADPDIKRLSWLANRTAAGEGSWPIAKIEGEIPKELAGTLYRVGPGQKETFGVPLKHFFDGDAYVKAYSFRDGRASLRGQFVATPERGEEIAAGKMLYAEFGTLPAPLEPGQRRRGMKNQPNVNIISWDGRLLGLSEGGHPSAISPNDLSFLGYWDFYGTLPRNVPFTAHPKFDAETGVGYAFGIEQGMAARLMVYRMEKDGRLTQLYAYPLKTYLMIHDMVLAGDYLVFVIPPVKMNIMDMLSGKSSLADALHYFESEPLRLLVARRDGQGEPKMIEQPSALVFHHGNGFARDGKLVWESMLATTGGAMNDIANWRAEKFTQATPPIMTRLEIDPEAGTVVSRKDLETNQEFPRFDMRRASRPARYLYTMHGEIPGDPFAFTRLLKHDLEKGASEIKEGPAGCALGETVFAPREGGKAEDDGWLFQEGYDAARDETYMEIKDAATLEFAARIWTGRHLPLGFHGNFVPGAFVEPASA